MLTGPSEAWQVLGIYRHPLPYGCTKVSESRTEAYRSDTVTEWKAPRRGSEIPWIPKQGP